MIVLREYQERVVEAVKKLAASGRKRILVVMPTGSGKTFCMSSIVSGAIGKQNKSLSIMHRRGLVDQMIERYQEFGLDPGCIMAGKDYNLGKQCQVASLFTYSRRLQLADHKINKFWIDAPVLLIDECHHILSKTYQTIMNHYKDSFIVGFTATPTLSNGAGLGQFFDSIVNVVNMKELLEDGNLVPGEYYGPSDPDLSKLKIVQGDYDRKGLDEKLNKPQIIGDVVDNWFELASDKQTMIFSINRKHGKAICNEFIHRGIKAEYLDAHSDDELRSDVIHRFRNGDTQVISQVALYLEGTDIKEIECLAIARPTKSLGLHRQILGRGARPDPASGKKSFMVLDFGGNVKRLGFYEDEIDWTLDDKRMANKLSKPRIKEKRIMECKECDFLFSGTNVCPQCGTKIKDYGKKVAALDAELVGIGKIKKPEPTMAEKQRFYQMLEYYRREKGYKEGWLGWTFKFRFKTWPRGFKDLSPIEPDANFKKWITYMNIRKAKSKKRVDNDSQVIV